MPAVPAYAHDVLVGRLPRRRSRPEDRIELAERARFAALALDLGAARRGAPHAIVTDPAMIAQWSLELRARWDSLAPGDRTLIRGDLISYGDTGVEPGSREDADAALLFLDGEARDHVNAIPLHLRIKRAMTEGG